MKTISLLSILLLGTSLLAQAETVTDYILDTVDSGDGRWPCLYYELNYNTDIAEAEKAKWYSLDEDESYWREGYGPFSIDQNKFLVTQWQSTLHPLLIRRHFTLTQDDLDRIAIGTVTLLYSYDEDPVIWLNGKKLASATGWNDNSYDSKQLVSTQKKWLVEGDNVICVSMKQGAGGGHIDFGLTVRYNNQHDGLTPALLYNNVEDTPAYNLQGQPVPPRTHGIIVRQGKKVAQ